ncbi:MAG: CaiB/BaiF CoA transferase family protein [Planctomycetaceae bacterium]
MSSLPLAGLRVLDLSRVLAGPFCTMQLADLGAEVIKVERPGTGDETRLWGPPFVGGESAYFLCCNRNKRSLTLELATPAGRQVLSRLLGWADVLVENFVPGTLDRWGFSSSELRARYPRLITCHISGFGQTGPRRDEPGYDLLIQAGSGLMSITGEPDGPPTKVGVAITDVVAGLFASQSILAALVGRSLSGHGTDLDIALFDCALACLVNVGQGHLVTGEPPARVGSAHSQIVPYQLFAGRDGQLVLGIGTDAQFARFCEWAGLSQLGDDPRLRTNAGRVAHRAAVVVPIAARLRELAVADVVSGLTPLRVPVAAVQSVSEALRDPQAVARKMIAQLEHPGAGLVGLVAHPVLLDGQRPAVRQPPPRLGEHSREILATLLGLPETEIDTLEREGVI